MSKDPTLQPNPNPWSIDINKFDGIVISLVCMIAFGPHAYREYRYWRFGKTIQADVIQTIEVEAPSRRSRGKPILDVEFTFRDSAGVEHRSRERIQLKWPIRRGQYVLVDYIPGEPDSIRLMLETRLLSIIIVGAAFLLLVGSLIYVCYRIRRNYLFLNAMA